MSANNKKNNLMVVHNNLEKLIESKKDAMPKDFNQTRFLQNAMTVLTDTKGIERANPLSVARTMLKGAFLGLDFFNKECYAIIYGGQVQFQTDYKGEIKLAKKYSINPIKDIYAKLVKRGDYFEEYIESGKQVVNFKPVPFSDEEIVGAFAVVYFKDGSMIYETMSSKEIEETRKNYSKAPNSPAWKNSKGEMYKKTVLRRLLKLVELDFDNQLQQESFEDSSEFDMEKLDDKANVPDPFEYEIVEENEEEIKGEIKDSLKEDEIPEILRG